MAIAEKNIRKKDCHYTFKNQSGFCSLNYLFIQTAKITPFKPRSSTVFLMKSKSTFFLFLVLVGLLINFSVVARGNFLPQANLQRLLQENDHLLQLYAPTLEPVQNFMEKLLLHSEQLGTECSQSIIALREGFLKRQLWAIEYYDASGKGISGRLAGYKHDLGNFDQCLALRSQVSSTRQKFAGQYCAVSVMTSEYDAIYQQPKLHETIGDLSPQFKRWIQFNLGHVFGLCIPSTCHPETLFDVVNKELRPSSNISLIVQRECTRTDLPSEPLTVFEKVAFSVIVIAICLVLFGSAVPIGIMRHFCAIRNFKKILKPVQDFESRRVQALHGAKFFYILLSASAHCWYVFMPLLPIVYDGVRRYDIGHPILREFSASSMLLPDGMFFLSGFLTVYIWFPVIAKSNEKLTFTKYFVSRWLRTAPLVIAVLFMMRVSERFGSGPFFKELSQHEQTKCSQNFWMNLLFINNYQRGLEICMPHTWYLSADFQLYLLHYFTVILLYRNPKAGLTLAFAQIFSSMGLTGFRTYYQRFPAYLRINEVTIVNLIDTEVQYLNALLHSSCYTLGIIAGYLIRRNVRIINFSSPLYLPLWVFFIGTSLSAFFIPYLWEQNFLPKNDLLLAIWSAFVRPLFVSGFFWGFLCVYERRAKLASFIFEQSFMVVISRMGFSIVISQYVYLHYMLGSARQMQRFNTFDQLKESIAGSVFILTIGLFTYLLFEAPIVNLMFSVLGTKKIQKEVRRMSKLRIDLNILKEGNQNLNNDLYKNGMTNGNRTPHLSTPPLSPCSPDIESKQL